MFIMCVFAGQINASSSTGPEGAQGSFLYRGVSVECSYSPTENSRDSPSFHQPLPSGHRFTGMKHTHIQIFPETSGSLYSVECFLTHLLLCAFVEQVTRLTRVAERLSTCPQLAVRLSSLSSTLATKVPPRVLLPTLTQCYNSMVDSQQVCVIYTVFTA